MPTDEELARIAWAAYVVHDDDVVSPETDPMLDVVRALRAALLPAVAPLGPEETVTIPTQTPDAGYGPLSLYEHIGNFLVVDGCADLDAAGVDALIEACRRWQAAQDAPESAVNAPTANERFADE